jgi:hypothetical protein
VNAAFNALERAKREAQARLERVKSEGRKSEYKLPGIRQDIREYEEALQALKYALETKLAFIRLWQLVEEGNLNSVQVHSSRKHHRRVKGNK